MGFFEIFKPKVSLIRSGFLNGFCDNHIHLLPGVDDGIQDMEDAIKLLDLMESAGVKAVWCTPHVMEDIPNKTSDLKNRFEELKSVYKGKIDLHLAAEYMMDVQFLERLENNDLLLHTDNHILVESSTVQAPFKFENTLEDIMHKGHYVILAHPERYVFLDMKKYKTLKDMKVKFQLNLTSLLGYYGPAVKEKAEKLLELGYYNCVGTDTHRVSRWAKMEEMSINKKTLKQVRAIPGL